MNGALGPSIDEPDEARGAGLALATLPMSDQEFPTPRLTDVFVAGEGDQ